VGKDLLDKDLFRVGNPKKDYPQFLCVGADAYSIDSKTQVPNNPTNENERSLLSIIWWPGGRVSYYCGGDGNFKLETESMIPYLMTTRLMDEVTVMKLDHHGSAGEFRDGEVLRGMKPHRIIVTPGQRYGHPCMSLHLLES
jgi:beta-lactamase superfamily II metal-dependent hydrolase